MTSAIATSGTTPSHVPQALAPHSPRPLAPSLEHREADWRTQAASALFCLPTDALGVVGAKLANFSISCKGAPKYAATPSEVQHLGPALRGLALTCKAGYSLALHICSGLDDKRLRMHRERQWALAKNFFSRQLPTALEATALEATKQALFFIEAQTPGSRPALGWPGEVKTQDRLLEPGVLAYLPSISYSIDKASDLGPLLDILRQQSTLPREQRNGFALLISKAGHPELPALIAASRDHGRVQFKADEITPALIALLEENMLTEGKVAIHGLDHVGEYLEALAKNISFKSAQIEFSSPSEIDLLLASLRNSPLEELTIHIRYMNPVSSGLASFVKTQPSLKRLVLLHPGAHMGPHPGVEFKEAGGALAAAIKERQRSGRDFRAEIPSTFLEAAGLIVKRPKRAYKE